MSAVVVHVLITLCLWGGMPLYSCRLHRSDSSQRVRKRGTLKAPRLLLNSDTHHCFRYPSPTEHWNSGKCEINAHLDSVAFLVRLDPPPHISSVPFTPTGVRQIQLFSYFRFRKFQSRAWTNLKTCRWSPEVFTMTSCFPPEIETLEFLSTKILSTKITGRKEKPNLTGRNEPNRWALEPAGTGRGTEPNRTEPDRATTRPKNAGRTAELSEPNRTEPNQTEPMNFRKKSGTKTNRTEPVPSWNGRNAPGPRLLGDLPVRVPRHRQDVYFNHDNNNNKKKE